jgi:hypothetical protein
MSATAPTKTRKALTPAQTDARNARRREAAAEKRTAAKKAARPNPKGARKKMKRATNLKGRKTRTDWDSIIYKLQHGPKSKTLRHRCSTPGVAQVTRVRLLDAYDGIEAETRGVMLILSRA